MTFLLALLIGIITPIQTSANSILTKRLHSEYLTSLIVFVTGMIPLVFLTLLVDGSVFFSMQHFYQEPFWVWLGGVFGALIVFNFILLNKHLGPSQTAILPVLGLIGTSTLIDHFGWFHATVKPITLSSLIGTSFVIIGTIGTIVFNQQQTTTHASPKRFWQLYGIFQGILLSLQAAVNGYLSTVLNASFKAALFSFFVGTLLTAIITVFFLPKKAHIVKQDLTHPWWQWIGGIIGTCTVVGTVVATPLIGVGLLSILMVSGQTISSLLIEQFGWLHTPVKPVTWQQLCSVLVIILGITCIQFVSF